MAARSANDPGVAHHKLPAQGGAKLTDPLICITECRGTEVQTGDAVPVVHELSSRGAPSLQAAAFTGVQSASLQGVTTFVCLMLSASSSQLYFDVFLGPVVELQRLPKIACNYQVLRL